jgi:hypothetical protein
LRKGCPANSPFSGIYTQNFNKIGVMSALFKRVHRFRCRPSCHVKQPGPKSNARQEPGGVSDVSRIVFPDADISVAKLKELSALFRENILCLECAGCGGF